MPSRKGVGARLPGVDPAPRALQGTCRTVPSVSGETDRMRSRIHPSHKTKYRVQNWPEYERGLVQRGDITVWLTPGAISAWSPKRIRSVKPT